MRVLSSAVLSVALISLAVACSPRYMRSEAMEPGAEGPVREPHPKCGARID